MLTRINGLQRRHAYRHSEELKINEEEGTPGGSLFRAVNAIADGLKDEFPDVAIDTLAYLLRIIYMRYLYVDFVCKYRCI